MGRTNVVIDDDLIARALEVTNARTKREVIELALRRLVANSKTYRALRRMRGRYRWQGDLDDWRRSPR